MRVLRYKGPSAGVVIAWVVVVALAVGVVGATIGTGIPPIDDSVSGLTTGANEPENGSEPGLTDPNVSLGPNLSFNVSGGAVSVDTSLNDSKAERWVHRYVNRERSKRGLSNLSYDTDLAAIAQSHSDDMDEHDYFSHTGRNGATFNDRYQRFGYSCRIPTGGNRYLTGAENIWSSGRSYVSEKKLAKDIVESWMNSPGHRRNILTGAFRHEGIGINASGTTVYATQNFC